MLWLFALAASLLANANADTLQEWKVSISDSSSSPFYHFWDKSVGSGHAALMLREDWRAWLKQGVDHIGFQYVRGHGILDDDVGSVNGVNDYSFINIDKIYQHLLSINVKPYVEISFMPDAFASGNATICHYKGNKTPPKDYNVWGNFIQQWVQHLVDQFGIDEVSTWYFEVWNEPFGKTFWDGTFQQYYELYNYTALAIKSVSDKLRVGGPAQCCVVPSWLDGFLNYTFTNALPIDFVSWHSYPNTKASLASFVTDEIVPLQQVVQKYNTKYGVNLPVYISEWSSTCCAPQSGYDDEYNAAYLIYVAMYFQQTIYPQQADSMIKWMSYWSISDVFEEGGFNSNEFNGLYGMQTIRGIPKPAFRAMQLLNTFGGNVSFETSIMTQNNVNETVIVYALKNANAANRYSVFVANFNSAALPIQSFDISVYVNNGNNANKLSQVSMYRIDAEHTNPIVAWKNMSSPVYPNQKQLQSINATSQLVEISNVDWKQVNSSTVQINFNIPVYGVVVLDLQYS